jgi:hypothetical protein
MSELSRDGLGLPPLTDLELLLPRVGVDLELALLRLGERLEREAELGLLAQRAQLKVIGGVERCGDRDVEVDQLEKLPPQPRDSTCSATARAWAGQGGRWGLHGRANVCGGIVAAVDACFSSWLMSCTV